MKQQAIKKRNFEMENIVFVIVVILGVIVGLVVGALYSNGEDLHIYGVSGLCLGAMIGSVISKVFIRIHY